MAFSFDEIVVSKSQTRRTRPKKILERVLHFLAYHFILSRRSTRHVSVAGLDLTVGPTVFDPRFFLTSEFFAEFIIGLVLIGKAAMTVHPVSKKSFVLESIIVYELRRSADAMAAYGSERSLSLADL